MESENDLVNFMQNATIEMSREYARIQKRAREDPGTAGDQGEENWAELLKQWLPSNLHIVTKGRILAKNGVASPQIDILVLQPEYPTYLLNKKLYLADGVVAAFECKLTLKANHIVEFFKNSKEIKTLSNNDKGTPYKELFSGIFYGLLAHSHSWNSPLSKPIENIHLKIIQTDYEVIEHPIQMPDVICVANLGTWVTSKMVFISPKHIPNWEDYIQKYGANGSAGTSYIRHSNVDENQLNSFTPIGSMITYLLDKIAFKYPNLRTISQYFISCSLGGIGGGHMRCWSSDIYSESVKEHIELGNFVSGQKFNEWNSNF